MHLIDTHTHLDFPEFDEDRSAVLQRSQLAGVQRMVVLGVSTDNWSRLWQLVEQTPMLYGALGLHPVYLAQHPSQAITQLRDWLQRLAGHAKLCAVGECGLDYFLPELDKQQQQQLFEAHIQLAIEFELPLLLHVRRAHAPCIATLKRFKPMRGGIIHAFSGSAEEAREYIRLGFKLGLGGAATWPQALRMHRVIAQLPEHAIVLETDSPDMAPAMYAGQRNSPEHLPAICQALAHLRSTSAEQLAQLSSDNACQLFGWPNHRS